MGSAIDKKYLRDPSGVVGQRGVEDIPRDICACE